MILSSKINDFVFKLCGMFNDDCFQFSGLRERVRADELDGGTEVDRLEVRAGERRVVNAHYCIRELDVSQPAGVFKRGVPDLIQLGVLVEMDALQSAFLECPFLDHAYKARDSEGFQCCRIRKRILSDCGQTAILAEGDGFQGF